jgi:hypothetical protein
MKNYIANSPAAPPRSGLVDSRAGEGRQGRSGDDAAEAAPPRSTFATRKPAARVAHASLFDREVIERLSHAAVELIVERAGVLSEGGRARSLPRPDGTRGPDPFFGSTMLTLDLADLGDVLRGPLDSATAARVALLLTSDARAGRRARRLAEREAARLAGGRIDVCATEVRVRAVGTVVHIDVDVEGRLAGPAPALARG